MFQKLTILRIVIVAGCESPQSLDSVTCLRASLGEYVVSR
jgi:hypothetical protein